MDYKKRDYKEIFSERLYNLSEEYVERKKQEIKELNKEIKKQNKEKKNKAKLQMANVNDYQLIPIIKSYSLEKMVEDIENKYPCGINTRNFGLYRRGESFPDDPFMIKSFADFFQVSFAYLYGVSDIPNELNNKVQETIHLNSTAISTLISYNENQTVLTVMNALLSDKESSAYLFMNMYEEAYQTYKQEKSIGSMGEFDTDILLKKFINAESLSRYLEKHLLPFVKEDFEQRLKLEADHDYWRSFHYDEYEKEMIEDLQFAEDSGSVTADGSGAETPMDKPEEKP